MKKNALLLMGILLCLTAVAITMYAYQIENQKNQAVDRGKSDLAADRQTIEEFDSPYEWRASSCQLNRDEIDKKSGKSSLAITAIASGKQIFLVKRLSFFPAENDFFGCWVKIGDAQAVDSIQFRFSGKINLSEQDQYYCTDKIYTSVTLHDGWNYLKYRQADMISVNGEKWGNFHFLKLVIVLNEFYADDYFKPTAKRVQSATIKVDGMTLNPKEKTVVLLSFDDSQPSFYSEIFPAMQKRGMKGTLFVCTDHVQSSPMDQYMTVQQHDRVYQAGWDIGNHSKTHADYRLLRFSQIVAEMKYCHDWLIKRGYRRGEQFGAYPGDAVCAKGIEAALSLGYKLFRGNRQNILVSGNPDDAMQLPTYEIKEDTTEAEVVRWINKAYETGSAISIFAHGVADQPGPPYFAAKNVIDRLLAAINAYHLQTMTWSEWYQRDISR